MCNDIVQTHILILCHTGEEKNIMAILRALTNFMFLPGTIVLSMLGVTVEEDSGILRSFINSVFWGIIVLLIALAWVE